MAEFRISSLEALGRLCGIALRDTGQSRRVADFLLAWHNAEENGAWDPTDLWTVDTEVADDIVTVLLLARETRQYPGDLGFDPEMQAIWHQWRGTKFGVVPNKANSDIPT